MTAVWFLRRWWRHLCGDDLPEPHRDAAEPPSMVLKWR